MTSEALTQGPIPEINTYGINMVSETFAVAQVEFITAKSKVPPAFF